jgi:hypothetical protein
LFVANAPTEEKKKKIAQANQTMAMATEKAGFKTIEYCNAQDARTKIRSRDSAAGKAIAVFLQRPPRWRDNPLSPFYTSEEANEKAKPKADETKIKLEAAPDDLIL